MLGYEALADALVKEGVEVVFAVVAEDSQLLMIDLKKRGIRLVSCRNERGAVGMADGYHRVTGKPGVCSVTAGPGLTNTGTSLTTANRHRSALLCLTTEMAAVERHWVKATDQRRFSEATAGTYLRARHPETLAEDIALAFREVCSGHGPAVFAVPQDIMKCELDLDWEYEPSTSRTLTPQRPGPDPHVVAKAATLLSTAERPVILLGKGAFTSGAGDEASALSGRIGALLATTLKARGFLSDHPFHIGISGPFGNDLAHELLPQADVLVGAGASLSVYSTEFGLLYPEAKVIHIDTDPARIGDNTPIAVGIAADAKATLAAINAALAKQPRGKGKGFHTDEVRSKIAGLRSQPEPEYTCSPGTIDPRQLVAELDRLLPPDRIVAVDGGHFGSFVTGMKVTDPSRLVMTGDFASVGMGLYQGIGAAIGRPDRHVCVICGDGGFMMTLEELDTAVRYRLPITVVIMNDCAFGAEVHMLEVMKKPVDVALFDNPEFAEVGRALGAVGVTVRNVDDLRKAAALIGKGDRPLLIDAKVDRSVVHEMWRGRTNLSHPPGR